MAEIVLYLEDAVLEALKHRAGGHNRSIKAEIRFILARAVGLVPMDEGGIYSRRMSFRDFVGIATVRWAQSDIDS